MKYNLSKARLKNYTVSRSDYFEKFREKYNENGRFYSWNWVVVFFPYAWTVYRKLWGPFFLLMLFNYLIVVFSYPIIIHGQDNIYLLVIAALALLSGSFYYLYLIFKGNNLVLSSAQRNAIQEDDHTVVYNGKNNYLIVIMATIIFLLPNIAMLHQFNLHTKAKIDKENIALLDSLNKSDPSSVGQARDIISQLDSENINDVHHRSSMAAYNVVCLNEISLLNLLAEKGAYFSESDLYRSVNCNAINSIKFLFKKNVEFSVEKHKVAICQAASRSQSQLINVLLENGANIGDGLCKHGTILEYVINNFSNENSYKIVKLLINNGGDEFQNSTRNNIEALKHSVVKNNIPLTKYLLEYGIDTDDGELYGNVVYYSLDLPLPMIELLLRFKADSNGFTRGESLLEHAVKKGSVDKVRLLLKYGATISPASIKYADEKGLTEIKKILENQKKK